MLSEAEANSVSQLSCSSASAKYNIQKPIWQKGRRISNDLARGLSPDSPMRRFARQDEVQEVTRRLAGHPEVDICKSAHNYQDRRS